ncbi:MAG: imidazole glycerol phosphate synthase subunit HisH [bacterium]
MRVTIFDYGAGNLHSLGKALETADVTVAVETDPTRAIETDVLVLPGVGAFGSAAARLAPGRAAMRGAIVDGLPTLGICLGMQLFFYASEEGAGAGLGLIPGRVSRLAAERVPQIGWNTLLDTQDPLLDAAPLPIAYYANSFVCRPSDPSTVVAWSEHEGDRFPAVVRAGSALGVQFHPEKSSSAGVRFLHAFLDEARATKGAR